MVENKESTALVHAIWLNHKREKFLHEDYVGSYIWKSVGGQLRGPAHRDFEAHRVMFSAGISHLMVIRNSKVELASLVFTVYVSASGPLHAPPNPVSSIAIHCIPLPSEAVSENEINIQEIVVDTWI